VSKEGGQKLIEYERTYKPRELLQAMGHKSGERNSKRSREDTMEKLTLSEWLGYSRRVAVIYSCLKKLDKLLSRLRSSNPHVCDDVMRSQEKFSTEELKAMVDFIGAERLPPEFKLSRTLHEIERVLEYE